MAVIEFIKKIISMVIALILGIFGITTPAQEPTMKDNYYESTKTGTILEQKYTYPGEYSVLDFEIDSDNESIKKYYIAYPEKPGTYPAVIIVNASNCTATEYKPYYKHLASWGFVVIGNDDPQTGTGVTTSITLDYLLSCNDDKNSAIYKKVDTDRIGINGSSQGASGALKAATDFENSNKIKSVYAGSLPYPELSTNMGWGYDITKLNVPIFMTAGTAHSDAGGGLVDFGVCPLEFMIENYNLIPTGTKKVMGRVVGAEHEDMFTEPDGYMTAWMLYTLKEDTDAEKVFDGANADILLNSKWQDIKIDL